MRSAPFWIRPSKMTCDLVGRQRLMDLLSYDPLTGVFIWKIKTSNRACVGKTAGTKAKSGYVSIQIDGKIYGAHRLAWLYVHGEWPPFQVDHRNRDRSNNRIKNLRLATPSQNGCNSTARSPASGVKGVSWSKQAGKWQASIGAEKKRHHLGYFNSKEDAAVAISTARKELHGEFANHG